MDALEVYLQQHWVGSAGGLDLVRRVARSHAGTPEEADLRALASSIAEDRAALRELMVAHGISPATLTPLAARLAERVGRLKPNGRLLRRSPVSDVLELEALRGAVGAKRAGWEALLTLGPAAPGTPGELRRLVERADAQLERLATLHGGMVRQRLAPQEPDTPSR